MMRRAFLGISLESQKGGQRGSPFQPTFLEHSYSAVVEWIAKVPMPPCDPSSSFPKIQTLPDDGTTPANRRSSRKVPFVGLGLGARVQVVPSQCESRVI